MNTAAPSAHPPWAVFAWADDNAIYVELPALEGPPYVMKFAKTEGGLGKALNLMREVYEKAKPKVPIASTRHPLTNHRGTAAPAKLDNADFTKEQRSAAHDVLKKLGMI